jgi:cytochrome c biogenesis protein CcdA
VLTIAATHPNPLVGAGLLFTYSFGTATPLFLIAWLWDRYELGRKAWLRGKAVQLGPFQTHSTSLIAGVLFILLGVSFIAFQGASVLSGVYAQLGLEELGFLVQGQIQNRIDRLPSGILLGTEAALIVGFLIRRLLSRS